MLTVRKAQLDAFVSDFLARFEARILAEMQVRYPKACEALGLARCKEIIHQGVKKAEAHSIAGEDDVFDFVELFFELGTGFETDPDFAWIQSVLEDGELPGDGKMELITARLGSYREHIKREQTGKEQ